MNRPYRQSDSIPIGILRISVGAVRCLLFWVALAAGSVYNDSPIVADDEKLVSYSSQIGPFFQMYCVGCHSGEESKGGLDLTGYSGLQAGGESGEKLIVAGKSDQSLLWKLISGAEEPAMPPKESKQPEPVELELIRRWIDEGGTGPSPGAAPIVPKVDLPNVTVKHSLAPAAVSLTYRSDGSKLYVARGRLIDIFDTESGEKANSLAGDEYPFNRVALSKDGKLIVAAGGVPGISGKLWIFGQEGKLIRTIEGHEDSIYGLDVSPDGMRILTGSYDKLLKLWDVSSGKELLTLKHHTAAVFECRFSPDGAYLASASADQTVKIWDASTGERLHTLTEGTRGMNAVAWKSDGSELAAGGIDKIIRTWSWNNKEARLKRSAFAHDGAILALEYHSSGAQLYSSGEDRQLKSWDVNSLSESFVFDRADDWGQAMSVSPTGARLAVAYQDGKIKEYSTTTGKFERIYFSSIGQASAVEQVRGTPEIVLASDQQEQSKSDEKPNPPAPQFSGISPEHVTRGNKLTLTLTGRNIWNADRVWMSPDFPNTLLKGDPQQENQIKIEVEIPGDAPRGLCSVQLHTPLGTTETKRFYVGPFPEIGENEDHLRSPPASGKTDLNFTWVGRIESPGDIDFWPFEARQGEEIVFEVQGKSLGSTLDPKLSILDSEGKKIEESKRMLSGRPVWVGFRVKESGRYVLQVEDRNFSGSGGHHYLIHAGNFPYLADWFPLGISRGDVSPRIFLTGFNLGEVREFSPKNLESGHHSVQIPVGETKTFNVIDFEVADSPEMTEEDVRDGTILSVPVAVSGRIEEVEGISDEDTYRFAATRGERLTLEVIARRNYGSPLDSDLAILDSMGNPLARSTIRPVAETYTVLRDHDSRGTGIRLQNWNEFRENEFLMLGNEIVQILKFPAGPDSDVKFYSDSGLRKGMFGTTPTGHALNSPVYKVEIHPPAMSFPPNGMPLRQLFWENDDGGAGYESDSMILFDVPADGDYQVRIRDVRRTGGSDYKYRLVIRERREDFTLAMNPANPNVPLGGTLPVTISLKRREDFTGPVEIDLSGVPRGISATPVRIEPNGTEVVFTLTSDGIPPELTWNEWAGLKVSGRGIVHGKEVVRPLRFAFDRAITTLTSPPTLGVSVSDGSVSISRGGTASVQVTIERRNGFKGRVPLEVMNLPQGLTLLDVGLNGILITENQTSRSFSIYCEDYMVPGEYLIYAVGKVESLGEKHPSIPIRVMVTAPERTAAN